jgi:acetyltransferase
MELALMSAVLLQPLPAGKNIAIITHAGGPAVMLTDVLSNGGLQIPPISGPAADELLSKLYHGSSVANPIDFLATGTAEQLGLIIDACENEFDHIDAMAVIFGNPGLAALDDVYELLLNKLNTCKKPIYAILTSVADVPHELPEYIKHGKVAYQDEVLFGKTLALAMNAQNSKFKIQNSKFIIDTKKIREIIDNSANGYLSPDKVQALLDAAGIARAGEAVVSTAGDAVKAASQLGYPVVMKVVGPIHKSDVGGVVLNVKDDNTVRKEFERMMQIKDTTAILLQPQLSGTQLFVGANREPKFGHLIMCGLGGIFIEVLKDVAAGLAPLSMPEAYDMIRSLRSYRIIEGVRGQEPVNEAAFAEIIVRLSMLCEAAPEIAELDLNPLLGSKDKVVAVDARIRLATCD